LQNYVFQPVLFSMAIRQYPPEARKPSGAAGGQRISRQQEDRDY
jgi:hypothetical protein